MNDAALRLSRLAPSALVALLAAATPAWAALDSAALAQATRLAQELAASRAPAGARVVVLPGTPDPRLRLAACGDIRAEAVTGAPAWGRTRVGLRCHRGEVAWRVSVPLAVQVWAPAWVAVEALASGATLAESALQPAVVDWAAAPSPPLPAQGPAPSWPGRVLARALVPGQPLREADLRARQWFVAGDTVQVQARGSGFAVTAEAVAVSAGVEGRPAQLKSAQGRLFTATPVGERRAELRL
jgi:flagellar basal body P-ring formation protein FlgA